MGPTASGKSALAEQLAETFDGELISVDSALVYRGLSIGAAKPDYPHHLIHIRDPADPYTAADFARDAAQCIRAVRDRGRQPILVGGSMLYFRALIQGLDEVPAIAPEIRADIEAEAQAKGWPALHAQLAEVDPATAERLHPNHSQRICRALEVYRETGTPLSEWQGGQTLSSVAGFECIALCPEDRSVLHQRITKRLSDMFDAGLVDEVRALRARGDLHTDLPAVRAIGYRQVWEHLAGQTDLADCREKVLAATRQLAKRQLTWLRSWPDLTWVLTDQAGRVVQIATQPVESGLGRKTPAPEASERLWKGRILDHLRNF
ncbi:MAG: tRNA (adenosine(37)-N6)-dimethylallyltransferase MiaA [Luminiphilus sp.]|nr:tRNA (adenosine(37)-N6)-dimethylallyltransferase MiaA [Luminiphilus sp.]